MYMHLKHTDQGNVYEAIIGIPKLYLSWFFL